MTGARAAGALTIENIPADDLLHTESRPGRYWSTANVGEALPGVVTPLGWSVWGPSIDIGMKDAFRRTGALEPARVAFVPDPDQRAVTIFYGRGALSVNFLCEMGDRLPGTSGDAIARQLLGEVPPEIPLKRNLDRLHVVAHKMPAAVAMIRRQVVAETAEMPRWWSARLAEIERLDLAGAARVLDEARHRHTEMTKVQARGVFVGVQAMYDQVVALVRKSGIDQASANALMAGQGSHAETEVIADLWELGRGRLTLETFLSRHGYHGPMEGELSSRMWREDPGPVTMLAAQYADRPESEHPARLAEQRRRERQASERELVAKLPVYQRPVAELILRMAAQRIPLRGVAKEALQRAFDIARASARRIGALLAEQGRLSDPEDVFYLTAVELVQGLPENAAELVAQRRELRALLQRYDIPQHWGGTPVPFAIEPAGVPAGDSVTGIAASGGVVEGTARLVHDPVFTEVEPGEIIVCPTTDPSWASVLFLSAALVVDIGGPLSHAAVVSRELGIPCVIGTVNGTAILRTGDRVRVDGDLGTVEVLQRAGAATAEATT
jgi:pyruvate, water dikinase